MASKEHSGSLRALLGAGEGGVAGATSQATVTSDGLGCQDSRPAGRLAPTPLRAPLFEGGLAFTRRTVLGAAVAAGVSLPSMGRGRGGVGVELGAEPETLRPTSSITPTPPPPSRGRGSGTKSFAPFVGRTW